MGPIAIRARLVRLARRRGGRAIALVLALGAVVAVHHATMAMHDATLPVSAATHDATGADVGAPHGDRDHGAHPATDGAVPVGTSADQAASHAHQDAGSGDAGHSAATMAMAACLGVLGAVGAAVVALRVGVLHLGPWPALHPRPPGLRAGRLPAARPRAGPVFLVLAVDRR